MQRPTSDAASILKALIACRSVTPADAGAQAYLAEVLTLAGFTVTRLTFRTPGTSDVENLFATIGTGAPHLVFAGHTDVVPPGDEARWSHPPFAGAVADGMMIGRGAVDMKGGIAAFTAAALAFIAGTFKGTLSLLITGDEEGAAINGTMKLVAWAKDNHHRFDAALVGEPTSRANLGDTIKTGRRGSLSGTITVAGKQGHVAYPHRADNPIPALIRVLDRLNAMELDAGSADFQPSNLEITGIEAGTPAFNVIPGEAKARFNVRFNDHWSIESLGALLQREIATVADASGAIQFEPNASMWFLTRADTLIAPLTDAIRAVTGLTPEATTGGGTSDARFFKDICPVVEFGLVGDTMHQIDERVPLADLDRLTAIYRDFLGQFFGTGA
jgi:succinyl-diaminopimelate desuccinylase